MTLEASTQSLTGVLDAHGVRLVLEGAVEGGVGFGYAYGGDEVLGFEAYLQGTVLGLYVFELDASGNALVDSAVELLLEREPTQPAPGATIVARGSAAELSRDDALAFLEALEFVLEQLGYAYRFSEAERSEALTTFARTFPTMDAADQVVLAHARTSWERVRANWHRSDEREQHEFALGVLVLAFGEETVASWVGPQGSGGQGQALGHGSGCASFDDCAASFVDQQTRTDTFNAQGCWAAAGCESYDSGSGTFTYSDDW